MGLRRRLPDDQATYTPPVLGLNLRDPVSALQPGEARLLQNALWHGGTRKRIGSERITATTLGGSLRVRGGHRFYRADTTSQRLVAYGTKISTVNDAGAETILTSGMTNDLDTHFLTWPITDACYACNSTDTLRKIDNTGTLSTVSGTNIPIPIMLAPISDRVLGITTNGIERTNPRIDTVWSSNSTWATFRPSLAGRFTGIYPFAIPSPSATQPTTPIVVAFQSNAYYYITGSDFGDDVTAATPSASHDSRILLRDSRVGTSSPYSIAQVPGVGLFWFTSDLNVYWLPQDGSPGRFVGDLIYSRGSTAGIESTNLAALAQVWMVYFDRYLILGIPTGSNTYASTQFWMDLRLFQENGYTRPTWFGPMTGQTVGRVWPETQAGNNTLIGGEGNSATGAFVYQMYKSGVFNDAIGATDTAITYKYATIHKSFGAIENEKYVRSVQMNARGYTGTATARVADLEGVVAGPVNFAAVG